MAGQIVTTNAGNLALRYRKRAAALSSAMEKIERDNIAAAKKLAIEYSSARNYRLGGIKAGRKRVYPYSRARSIQPPWPPYMVNIQSGRFVQSWKTVVQKTADGYSSTLYNTDPKSNLFDGQPHGRMMARPILQAVMRQVQQPRFKSLAAAKSKALSAGGTGAAPFDGRGSGGGIGLGTKLAAAALVGGFMGAFNGSFSK